MLIDYIEFAHSDIVIFSALMLAAILSIFILAMFLFTPKKTLLPGDIEAIAGDDVVMTKLDMAKAYIELGKSKSAKQMLRHIIAIGNKEQKKIAKQLLRSIANA